MIGIDTESGRLPSFQDFLCRGREWPCLPAGRQPLWKILSIGKISWAALLPVALFAALACSSPASAPEAASAPETSPPSQAAPAAPAPSQPAPSTAPSAPLLQIALASSDISVGKNRVAFGVIDSQTGPLSGSSVQVSTFFLSPAGQEGPIETVDAKFHEWPVPPRGVYTARLEFDRPGTWGLAAIVAGKDGAERQATARIMVKETSSTPALGSAAPRSDSKTLDDVDSMEQITSDPNPDESLYQMTIAEALDEGKPLMVVFSTPAYCQTATCGPQLDVVKEIKSEYSDKANFIHVEVYDNPDQIQGDLNNAVVSPVLKEWRLPSEPWTFVIDSQGSVQSKFEAFTTREELEEALVAVLR